MASADPEFDDLVPPEFRPVSREHLFVRGDAFSIDWSSFDALYFYNPFEVEVVATDPALHEVDFRVQIARAEDRLAALPDGTRVVTLDGFGGTMPPSYRLTYEEEISILGLDLVLWIQGMPASRKGSAS